MALASMLQQGKGVPKNEERAIQLYTQAANQHNAQAALNLAKLYFQQGQVQQAKQWLEKAKEEGTHKQKLSSRPSKRSYSRASVCCRLCLFPPCLRKQRVKKSRALVRRGTLLLW